jgi:transposase-like protein
MLFEQTRWPSGAACPHCRDGTHVYLLQSKPESPHPLRAGVRKCGACRRKFTVTLGTIFEHSHVPLHKWLLAVELVCTSSIGISAARIQRELGLKSYRSAWFICRKLRWAMTQPPLASQVSKRPGGLRLSIETSRALSLLLQVKPDSRMPRPGAHRQKSVWAEVEEEFQQ